MINCRYWWAWSAWDSSWGFSACCQQLWIIYIHSWSEKITIFSYFLLVVYLYHKICLYSRWLGHAWNHVTLCINVPLNRNRKKQKHDFDSWIASLNFLVNHKILDCSDMIYVHIGAIFLLVHFAIVWKECCTNSPNNSV